MNKSKVRGPENSSGLPKKTKSPSMTGFGMARMRSSQLQLDISVRTVNGRYFEPKFHIPREYFSLESDFKKILSEFFQRGTIDIFIARKIINTTSVASEVTYNSKLALQYMKVYRLASQQLKMKNDIPLQDFLRLPDVVSVQWKNEVSQMESRILLATLRKACQACQKERLREGASLNRELLRLLGLLEKEVGEIESHRKVIDRELQNRYQQRIQARTKELSLDPARLAQEVIIQLDKADITEELSRLSEHLKNFSNLLGQSDSLGKKLDFYTQELLREINTIGSKSPVAVITQHVVEAKTLVERIREQVQNIE